MSQSVICATCQSSIAPGLLVCPSCQTLVYKKKLRELSTEAGRLQKANESIRALQVWREVLQLLPDNTQQYVVVSETIKSLSQNVDVLPADLTPQKKMPKALTALGAFGVVLWNFKFAAIFLLTKAKFLIMGLTKAQTFFSMLLAFGVYWSLWGWKFALGIVLSIYVHEMGHVFALKKFGIPTSWPIFIPGLGAFIRLKQANISPMEDARIGLAGPVAGLMAAMFCYVIFLTTGSVIWAAIAKLGAWINLFNLLPISPLDGGRGFHAFTKNEKWIACAVIGAMLFLTGEGLLVLILLAALYHAFSLPAQVKQDRQALLEYCGLIVVLSMLSKILVPGV